MKPKRLRLKIDTRKKSYTHKDSPLYKLKTKRKLADLLQHSLQDILSLRADKPNYSVFTEIGKSGKPREIQKPNGKLEVVHTRVASLLCRINAPGYLHSGRKGHSNVTNARDHIGAKNLLTTDIKSFFPSTTKSQVFSFFYRKMGCSPDVADILADLCTYSGYVPTGSRISMPVAYWANAAMFDELYSLSCKHSVTMTVYVDDLTFSGDAVNRLFQSCVRKVIDRYGHNMHPDKTVLYGANQAKLVTGVVVSGNELKVRNKHHYLLSGEIDRWKQIKHFPFALNMPTTNQLVGRLYSMGVIDPRFKAKAISVRNSTEVSSR